MVRARQGLVYVVLLLVALATAGCFGGGGGGAGGASATGVSGTLRNEFGNPVRGATVTAGTATTSSGADGTFRLTGLTAGALTLTVSGKGYVSRDFAVTVTVGKVTRLTEPGGTTDPKIETVHSLAAIEANLPPPTTAATTMAATTQPHTACGECHLPHTPSAGNPAFLKVTDQMLCQRSDCHAAPGGGTWEHPASHLDTTRIRPTGELAVYTQLGCLRCHLSHAGAGGTLTPGFPDPATNSGFTAYCATCHNPGQPGNRYDPATHNPGSTCIGCHTANGQASMPHGACARQGTGCHPLSSTLPLATAHRSLAGGCTACHDLAGSQPNLLKSSSSVLCSQAGCHAVVTPPQVEHAIAGCDGCHVVHGTSGTPDAKCYTSCHASIRTERMAGTSTHDVACAACHNGHVVTATQRVTNPFTKAAYPYNYLNSGAFCLLCHGLGADYLGAAEIEAGGLPVEKWPGAVNIVPEFMAFNTRVTGFRIGLRFQSEGGENGPWHDAGLNGHYAHWGDEYVANPPPGWPYVDGLGYPSLPDPCVFCHGIHAGKDPKIVRPTSGLHSDWTLYRTDHAYDCHYSCHAPLGATGLAMRKAAGTAEDRTIEATIVKRAASPVSWIP